MSHRLEVTYKGFDLSKDTAIDKAVGRKHNASGFCFVDKVRDLAFYFDKPKKGKSTKQCANEALAKLESAKIHGVKGKVIAE